MPPDESSASLLPTAHSPLHRVRLPDTRSSVTKRVVVANWDVYVTIGFYNNDQPGEIFAKIGKNGSTINGFTDQTCVFASMLLQCGVPAYIVADRLIHTCFEPNDQKHSSLADAIGQCFLESCRERGSLIELDHTLRRVDWQGQPSHAS